MSKDDDIFQRIGEFFKKNPKLFGVFVIALGLFMLAASIFNWNWIFAGRSFNLQKLEGISNMFGRGIARIFLGIGAVAVIGAGIVWIIASK
jgi:hypothetical protein